MAIIHGDRISGLGTSLDGQSSGIANNYNFNSINTGLSSSLISSVVSSGSNVNTVLGFNFSSGIGTIGVSTSLVANAKSATFSTPGTYTYTLPENASKLRLRIMGAGGGGSAGSISTTTQEYGSVWNVRTIGIFRNKLFYDIASNGSNDPNTQNFVIVGGYYRGMASSTDGVVWTSRTGHVLNRNFNDQRYISYGGGMWIQGHTGYLTRSTDAIVWRLCTTGVPSGLGLDSQVDQDIFSAATYGNGMYLVSAPKGRLIASTDTITWFTRTYGPERNFYEEHYNTASFYHPVFTAYNNGIYSYIRPARYSPTEEVATSTDTIIWTQRTLGERYEVNESAALMCIVGGGNNFVIGGLNVVHASTDGIVWKLRTVPADSLFARENINKSSMFFSAYYDEFSGNYWLKNCNGYLIHSTDTIHWKLRSTQLSKYDRRPGFIEGVLPTTQNFYESGGPYQYGYSLGSLGNARQKSGFPGKGYSFGWEEKVPYSIVWGMSAKGMCSNEDYFYTLEKNDQYKGQDQNNFPNPNPVLMATPNKFHGNGGGGGGGAQKINIGEDADIGIDNILNRQITIHVGQGGAGGVSAGQTGLPGTATTITWTHTSGQVITLTADGGKGSENEKPGLGGYLPTPGWLSSVYSEPGLAGYHGGTGDGYYDYSGDLHYVEQTSDPNYVGVSTQHKITNQLTGGAGGIIVTGRDMIPPSLPDFVRSSVSSEKYMYVTYNAEKTPFALQSYYHTLGVDNKKIYVGKTNYSNESFYRTSSVDGLSGDTDYFVSVGGGGGGVSSQGFVTKFLSKATCINGNNYYAYKRQEWTRIGNTAETKFMTPPEVKAFHGDENSASRSKRPMLFGNDYETICGMIAHNGLIYMLISTDGNRETIDHSEVGGSFMNPDENSSMRILTSTDAVSWTQLIHFNDLWGPSFNKKPIMITPSFSRANNLWFISGTMVPNYDDTPDDLKQASVSYNNGFDIVLQGFMFVSTDCLNWSVRTVDTRAPRLPGEPINEYTEGWFLGRNNSNNTKNVIHANGRYLTACQYSWGDWSEFITSTDTIVWERTYWNGTRDNLYHETGSKQYQRWCSNWMVNPFNSNEFLFGALEWDVTAGYSGGALVSTTTDFIVWTREFPGLSGGNIRYMTHDPINNVLFASDTYSDVYKSTDAVVWTPTNSGNKGLDGRGGARNSYQSKQNGVVGQHFHWHGANTYGSWFWGFQEGIFGIAANLTFGVMGNHAYVGNEKTNNMLRTTDYVTWESIEVRDPASANLDVALHLDDIVNRYLPSENCYVTYSTQGQIVKIYIGDEYNSIGSGGDGVCGSGGGGGSSNGSITSSGGSGGDGFVHISWS